MDIESRIRNARELRFLVNEAIFEDLRKDLVGTVHTFTSSKWMGEEDGWEECEVQGTIVSVDWDVDGEWLIRWTYEGEDGTQLEGSC
jgi:hypothetical protein